MHCVTIPAVDVSCRQARLRSSDSITQARVTSLHLHPLHLLLNSPKEISTIMHDHKENVVKVNLSQMPPLK